MADLNNLLGNITEDGSGAGAGDEAPHHQNRRGAGRHNDLDDDDDDDDGLERPREHVDGIDYDDEGSADRSGAGAGRAPSTAATTPPGSYSYSISSELYERLVRAWEQELACPELLYNDVEIVSHFREVLRDREDLALEVGSGMGGGGENAGSNNPRARRRQRGGTSTGGDDAADRMIASLSASVVRMECDRIRFILSDLTRVRMAKIERHALHNRDMLDRMSEDEVSYLQQYGQLIEKHFNRTVLNHLPKRQWRNLDGPEMIDRPDLDTFVFCRVEENILLNNSPDEKRSNEGGEEDDDIDEEGKYQEHEAGQVLIARYRTVRESVLDGKITLLS